MRSIFILAALAVAISASSIWPSSYYVETKFMIPYWNISQPISMYYDGANNRGNLQYYDGLDGFVYLPNQNISYQTFVWKDHMACRQYTGDDVDPEVVSLLPDLSTWEYKGAGAYDGIDCDVYEHIEMNDGRTNNYTFYVRFDSSKNPVPIAYHMLGYDVVFGSHYDIYIIEYGLYIPDYAPEEKFAVPTLCGAGSVAPSKAQSRPHSIVKLAMAGRVAEVGAHAHNMQHMAQHNTENKSFKMAPNHLTHLAYADIKASMMGLKGVTERKGVETYTRTYESVPDSWDWREHGAVTEVKDQGACGSCWTFGTIGAIEGAYAIRFGEQQMFSEQQVVDCAWGDNLDVDNCGCEGGFQEYAMDYIMANGVVTYEWAYPYKMIDDYCTEVPAGGVGLKSYKIAEPGDEEALKEALYKVGPMAISIDVTNDMVWYREGVFSDPLCESDPDYLDHTVTLVGYGTDAEQGDYWLVKNSWSTHWGDDGYIKIARNAGNMCGVATDAVMVPAENLFKVE